MTVKDMPRFMQQHEAVHLHQQESEKLMPLGVGSPWREPIAPVKNLTFQNLHNTFGRRLLGRPVDLGVAELDEEPSIHDGRAQAAHQYSQAAAHDDLPMLGVRPGLQLKRMGKGE
ncbi:hypothetical protein D3C72_1381680 [compost metagenome]